MSPSSHHKEGQKQKTVAVDRVAVPFHVLQLPLHRQHEIPHESISNDFLARRHQVWQNLENRQGRYKLLHGLQRPVDSSEEEALGAGAGADASAADIDGHADNNDNCEEKIWSGASPLERALVACCDAVGDDEEDDVGGALARGKQVEFLGLLARHCHNSASQALALAILERTIERDEAEKQYYEESEDESEDGDESSTSRSVAGNEDENDDQSRDEGGGVAVAVENNVSQTQPTVRHLDAPDPPKPAAAANKDERETSVDNNNDSDNERNKKMVKVDSNSRGEDESRTETVEEKGEEINEDEIFKDISNTATSVGTDKDNLNRISPFLAAGGLMILGGWLEDALTEEATPSPVAIQAQKKQKRSSSPVPPSSSHHASVSAARTGPIVLPLLAVLESIPFHKNLVKETKINKTIRNLKKKVDGAVTSYKGSSGKRLAWVDPVAGGNNVLKVQEAFENLMASWKEKAKESSQQPEPENALAPLLTDMRDHYQVLVKFIAGECKRPDWLHLHVLEKEQKQKLISGKQDSLSSIKAGRTTTRELEAIGRKDERAQLREAMQKTQKEKEEAMERLKQMRQKIQEQNLKRKAEKELSGIKKRRKVQWKDGLNADRYMKKDLLEEIFFYENFKPVSDEDPAIYADSQQDLL